MFLKWEKSFGPDKELLEEEVDCHRDLLMVHITPSSQVVLVCKVWWSYIK